MSKSRQRTLRIAVLIGLNSSYGRSVLRGVAGFASLQPNWRMFVEDWLETGRRDKQQYLDTDGIICGISDERVLKAIADSGVPAIHVSNSMHQKWLPSVLSDDRMVGEMAADYFLNRGFRRFAYFDLHSRVFSRERRAGFVARLKQKRAECSVFEAHAEFERMSPGETKASLRQWLKSLDPPVALLACNDTRCRHLASICFELGLDVPSQIALLGVDNDDLVCNLTTPPLSSVKMATHSIGRSASLLLKRMMAGGRAPRRPLRIPPIGVITRQSTDILAIEDPAVTSAIRFIRDNASRGIRVDQVVEQTSIGRRMLELRFLKCLNRTPAAEIRRVQIDTAKRLLLETSHSISQISRQTGFSCSKEFSVAFRRFVGTPPARFRSQSGFSRL